MCCGGRAVILINLQFAVVDDSYLRLYKPANFSFPVAYHAIFLLVVNYDVYMHTLIVVFMVSGYMMVEGW